MGIGGHCKGLEQLCNLGHPTDIKFEELLHVTLRIMDI